jgi:hypothetical protein
MIGEAASSVVEVAMAIAEGLKQVRKPRHIEVAHRCKFVDPGIERNGIFSP